VAQKYDSNAIPQQGSRNEINLKHLYNIIRRSLLRISLLTVLTALFAAIFIAQLPDTYKATAVVQLQADAVPLQTEQLSLTSVNDVLQNEVNIAVNRNDYYQTQIEILRSDQLTEKVIAQLKLRQHPYYTQPAQANLFIRGLNNLMRELNSLPDWPLLIQLKQALHPYIQQPNIPPEAQAFNAQIKSAVNINPVEKTQLINISYEHRNPELAARIANAYANVYIQHDRDFRVQQTINAFQWLEDGVQILKDNLNKAEQNLADFLQQDNLIDDSDAEQFTANELKKLTTKLNLIRNKKIIAEAQHQQASQTQNVSKDLSLIKKNELAIMAVLAQKKAEYRELVEHKTRYHRLRQALTSSRELYDIFLSQLKESRLKKNSITHVIDQSATTLASTATPPQSPFKPKRILIFVLVVLLTIITLILHAVLRAFYRVNQDNIIRLQPTLLGTLPNLKSAEKRFKQLSPQQLFQSNKTVCAAAQRLRTSLQMSTLGQKQQVIVITSAATGEGKSTAAIYLAMALAQSTKTIIIDADIRKPSIGKKMGIPKAHTGLFDILTEGGSLIDSIWYDEQTKLSVMPVGERPDNSLNLFSSKRFKSCLTILKSQYDYIIIDSPHSQSVSDTFVIGQSADVIIVVTRSNHSKKNEIDHSIALLARHNIKVNGIILNNVSPLDDKRYHNHKKIS
jgi:succinoglycan biosynthesis transport protein ExoP